MLGPCQYPFSSAQTRISVRYRACHALPKEEEFEEELRDACAKFVYGHPWNHDWYASSRSLRGHGEEDGAAEEEHPWPVLTGFVEDLVRAWPLQDSVAILA